MSLRISNEDETLVDVSFFWESEGMLIQFCEYISNFLM